jgi:biotin carboxyl carrier protein
VKLRITLEGKTYEVEVEVVEEVEEAPAPPPARAIKPPPPARVSFTQGRRGVKDEKNARSPLAAVVISVAVVAGQPVDKGDLLVVIEAMKMETRILAPAAGVVKAVHAAAGDAVKPGQVLVELA